MTYSKQKLAYELRRCVDCVNNYRGKCKGLFKIEDQEAKSHCLEFGLRNNAPILRDKPPADMEGQTKML